MLALLVTLYKLAGKSINLFEYDGFTSVTIKAFSQEQLMKVKKVRKIYHDCRLASRNVLIIEILITSTTSQLLCTARI